MSALFLRKARYLSLLAMALVFVLCYQVARPHISRHKWHGAVSNVEPALTVNYLWDVKPVLADRCYSCHAGTQPRGGLRLDTVAGLLKGGESGPTLVPGQPGNSLLLEALRGVGDVSQMPPNGPPLDEREIAKVQAWITEGAHAPAHEDSTNPARDHWAYQPLHRPSVPAVRQTGWVLNPIDAFVLANLERKGLVPSPPVRKELLLRRVYLDLIGLPPTPSELQTFLADTSPDAYEKVVDTLLASPRHAERWARHWMDVWRYSDPDGRKLKNDTYWSNEFLWRWRDWIIRSLHADRGYDQLVLEMLAGDELASNDPNALEGTGFLARSYFKLSRNVWLTGTVEHTSKAFLGLTMNCARCHDHKSDPISQQDYYRFRAIFEPHDIRTDQVPLRAGGPAVGLARAYDAYLDRPTYVFRRGDETNPDQTIAMAPGTPAFLGGALQISPVPAHAAKDEAAKNARMEVASTGRRLALARWIIDPRNPLTPRVAVNHLWTHHFGVGFVDTPAELGLRCKTPVLQGLLDYLAVELQSNGWSMKHIHRLIVTSNLYRMQSADPGSHAHSVDPDNRNWWRFPDRRMEAEVVRDSLLHLAGNLDVTQGGPPLAYPEEGGRQRRSLYYRYSREDKMEFLETFDAARVEECYRRDISIVPQQSLALLNSPFVWNQAHAIAQKLDTPDESAFVTTAFAALLCRPPSAEEKDACLRFLATQRALLKESGHLTPFPGAPAAATMPSDQSQDARDALIHVLINHNDFVTIR